MRERIDTWIQFQIGSNQNKMLFLHVGASSHDSLTLVENLYQAQIFIAKQEPMNSITGNITKNDKKDSRQTKRKTSLEFMMSKNAIIMYSSKVAYYLLLIGTNKKLSYTV